MSQSGQSVEDVLPLWGEKFAGIDLDLPNPSMALMTLAGHVGDVLYAGTLAWLATTHGDREVPIDLGPGRCRRLDSLFYDRYLQRDRGRPKAGQNEAMLVATDRALHYVAPVLGESVRWPWADADLTGRGKKVTVVTSEGRWKVRTGKYALPNFLAVARWAG